MKAIITFVLAIILVTAHGQSVDIQVLLDSAKSLFKAEREFDQQELDAFDYNKIVSLLNKVVEMDPDNAEARYFLGYAYSRLNSRDGRSMIDVDVRLVLKSSEQLEKVNTLTPKYSGELVILDPYSKLTSEWGSLAMSYWHHNKMDSAIWAFKEGRKRGGFGDFILELNRRILDACKPNSILVSSGDNMTIPLWFLQIVEAYRKDVAVIDVALLNTDWYPSHLAQTNVVAFDLPKQVLDTINYTTWRDSVMTIGDFSWTVKPSYYEEYLLRGDRVLLSLLRQNKFKRDVYFTFGFNEDSKLSLNKYLSSWIIVDQLTLNKVLTQDYGVYKKSITGFLQMAPHVNVNSRDEILLYNHFRFAVLGHVYKFLREKETKKAKELMEIFDQYADDKKVPYENNDIKEYVALLRESL